MTTTRGTRHNICEQDRATLESVPSGSQGNRQAASPVLLECLPWAGFGSDLPFPECENSRTECGTRRNGF
jgi:hypothetical protein